MQNGNANVGENNTDSRKGRSSAALPSITGRLESPTEFGVLSVENNSSVLTAHSSLISGHCGKKIGTINENDLELKSAVAPQTNPL